MKTNITSLSLRSETVQEILSVRPHWIIRHGNLITLTIFAALIAMAGWMPYPTYIPISDVRTSVSQPNLFEAKVAPGLVNVLFLGKTMTLHVSDIRQQTPIEIKSVRQLDSPNLILFETIQKSRLPAFNDARQIRVETTLLAIISDYFFK